MRVFGYGQVLLATLFACAVTASAQHDPGRGAVRLLAKGEVEAAVKMAAKAPKRMNSPISEAEHLFLQAMANSMKGDVSEAFACAKKAVQRGLPIERFAAGPREAFKGLYADPDFADWLQKRRSPLLHGPMLGSVTDRSASFWVRTAEEADVQVVVSQAAALARPLSATGRTKAVRDFTAVIEVKDLEPDTPYTYSVLVDGNQIGVPVKFKTFPRKGKPATFSIAFGGGAGFTPQYERMWTTIKNRNVDALLLLGDNVYIDDPEHTLTDRYCYYRRQSQPEWRDLVASVSVASIYDDHDFADNDCVPGPEIDTPPWKRDVWSVFKQNWNNPSYGGGSKHPGCWYDFMIGDVHFIMLDCRYYRDLKGGAMLGPVQKKWLLETLKSSKGTFKVLASSVPWTPGVKGKSKDTWDGFPGEREEIFSFVGEQGLNGVILMAADRHRTDMRKTSRPNGYDLYEVMSSRLTNVHTHSLVQDAKGSEFIMGYNEKCSVGLMEFDTAAKEPEVTFTIVNIDGDVIDSRTLKLSALRAP